MKRHLPLILLFVIAYGLFGHVAVSFAQIVGFSAPTNFATEQGPKALVVGDLNEDGKKDIAAANENSNSVSVLLGNGEGSFTTSTISGAGGRSIALGDFNGDGKQDLAVAHEYTWNVSILLGNGDGSFTTQTIVGVGGRSVAVGDFNGDGKQDLAVTIGGVLYNDPGYVSVLFGNGDGSFGAPTPFPAGYRPYPVVVGDFNEDGKQDLAVADWDSPNVWVLLGNGDGSFGVATSVAAGSTPFAVVLGDFNEDGKQDLALSKLGGSVGILLGNGDGSFAPPMDFAVGYDPVSVTIGDLNGDGKQDLMVANTLGTVSALLAKGEGSFGEALNFAAGSIPFSVAAGDFNEDGKQDLAVANWAGNNVSILLNVPAISLSPVTVGEGNSGTTNASFTVNLSEPSGDIVTVAFNVANVTATAGSDYVPTFGMLTFNPGETIKTITVVITGDTLNEANETFLVSLTDAVNGAVVNGQAVATIINDDPVTARISISDKTLTEGNSGTATASFEVTLSAASGQVITVHYSTANGSATAGLDYTAISGMLTFSPGETTKTITVWVVGDTILEPNETLFVNLHGATNATIEDSQGVGTIIDDEILLQTSPYFPIDSGDFWTYVGDGGSFTRTVLSGTVTINNVGTKALEDNNGFTQYFTNDSAGIRLHRQFSPNVDIGLSNPVDLRLTFSPPIVLANATMTVGESVMTSGTARTNKLPQVGVLELPYSSSFTAQGFEVLTVPLGSFQALKLQGYVNVGGEAIEETLYLVQSIGPIRLIDASGGVSETANLAVTNNFTLPIVSVTATSPTAAENGGSATVTVSRNGPTTQVLTVFYTSMGTATMGTDYKTLTGSVTIPIGAMSATVSVEPIDDILAEPGETVVLMISPSSSYSIGAPNSATVTIVDNDAVNPVAHVDCATMSLQSVIDSAGEGSTIQVTGNCAANLLVRNEKERITFDGGGSAVIVGSDPSAPALVVRGKGILIQGFIIRGGSDGIHVNRGSNAVIHNNLIEDTTGNGIVVDELAFAVITYNLIQNHPGAGIFISENSTARIGFNSDAETAASPNAIENNGAGIWVSNGSSARIVGNHIAFNNTDGIVVTRDSHADIASNEIDGNGGDGIAVEENASVQLGEDSGTSIYESPNLTMTPNGGFGLRCASGAVADGRIASLIGLAGAKSIDAGCIEGLLE